MKTTKKSDICDYNAVAGAVERHFFCILCNIWAVKRCVAAAHIYICKDPVLWAMPNMYLVC